MSHPFESFGPAPCRFVGLLDTSEVNERLKVAGYDGLEVGIGDEACIGSCDHCNASISVAVRFKSASGTVFKVGETCAKKALQPNTTEAQEMKKACNARRLAMKNAKLSIKLKACMEWLDNRTDLNDLPHPKGFAGLCLGDYFQWYRTNSGDAKFIEICKAQGFSL